ncbi:conjugal transfer protein TrbK (plasmid) [Rhizobium etli 8C-3]|uniref:Conjugal transfer protein TrbK n=1 Tax=Rhizobium etli 8C-3 TaxID=538025 RepID=A0A1L5PAV7_RHIET|nr:entry exclusion protein TrbK [Rhizobium etli]APO77289.1 conjugal transfer protein TrbK [Rhizobium etli 8C-3]
MNRAILVALLLAVAAVSSAATVLVITSRDGGKPALTEQRAARENFSGSGKELPPIKDGQEMRPRW